MFFFDPIYMIFMIPAFLLMALYVASIYLRNRNLQQDMTMLEEMEKTEEPVMEVRSKRKATNL